MRLVVWCVAFVAGDACALSGALGWRAGVAAAVVAALAITAARGRRVMVVATMAFVAAGAVLGARAARPAALHPVLAAAIGRDDAQAHVVEGKVVRGPESTATGARLVVALTRIDGAAATGTLALSVMRGWPDFGPGETIALQGAATRATRHAQPRAPRSDAGAARGGHRRAGRRRGGSGHHARRRAGRHRPAPRRLRRAAGDARRDRSRRRR